MNSLLLVFVTIVFMTLMAWGEAASDKNKDKERCFHHHRRRKKWCLVCHDKDDYPAPPKQSSLALVKDEIAPEETFPFVVGLIDDKGQLKCTGALITFTTVMTSATCVINFKITKVIAGDIDLSGDYSDEKPAVDVLQTTAAPPTKVETVPPLTVAQTGVPAGDGTQAPVAPQGPPAAPQGPPGARKRRNTVFSKAAYSNPDGQIRNVIKNITLPVYTKDVAGIDPGYDLALVQVEEAFEQTSRVNTIKIPKKLCPKDHKIQLVGFGCHLTGDAPDGSLRYSVLNRFKYEYDSKTIVFKSRSNFVGDLGNVMCSPYKKYARSKTYVYGIGSIYGKGTNRAMYANVFKCKEWIVKQQGIKARSLGISIIVSHSRFVALLIPLLTGYKY